MVFPLVPHSNTVKSRPLGNLSGKAYFHHKLCISHYITPMLPIHQTLLPQQSLPRVRCVSFPASGPVNALVTVGHVEEQILLMVLLEPEGSSH